MTEMELYQSWRKNAIDDPDLQSELSAIENDAEAIQDRFYRDLAFGTGGLRGVIGAGTNRMNIYTVRKATQGLANYVKEAFCRTPINRGNGLITTSLRVLRKAYGKTEYFNL